MAENRSVFQFKSFALAHGNPGLKISTEACVLGALAARYAQGNCLDLGTGCGLLAAMMAQANPNSSILALDIQEEVAQLAQSNLDALPFPHRIQVQCQSVQTLNADTAFDFIVCNPPFFKDHLPAQDPSKQLALHDEALPLEALAQALHRLLHAQGQALVLYPPKPMSALCQSLEILGLPLQSRCQLRHQAGAPVLRELALFSRQASPSLPKELCIRTPQGDYHPEFQELLSPYYLIFP